jgi:hypothetical protein
MTTKTTTTTAETTAETTRQRLALQLRGATVSVDDALQAAARLEARLEPPSILDHVTPDADAGPLPTLLRKSGQSLCHAPTALFEQLPNLTPVDLPMEWLMPFLAWGSRRRRWQTFLKCKKILKRAGGIDSDACELPLHDGITAGLVLFIASPKPGSALRQQLLSLALTHPVGSYLAAESNHLPEERAAITTALQLHSQLLHGLSQLPHFGGYCLAKARSDYSLWGGLILAGQSADSGVMQSWLKHTAEAACYLPAAAVAALVLQPTAPEPQKNLWQATLQHPLASRWAFECVWWSGHTWPTDQWEKLKAGLRPFATGGDRGEGWFNWSRLEPEWAYADYLQHPIDPMWAMEFLHQRYAARQPADDRPLRGQMVERLIQNHGDTMATVVLRFLDALKTGRDIR